VRVRAPHATGLPAVFGAIPTEEHTIARDTIVEAIVAHLCVWVSLTAKPPLDNHSGNHQEPTDSDHERRGEQARSVGAGDLQVTERPDADTKSAPTVRDPRPNAGAC
jgi:hypothetical protein